MLLTLLWQCYSQDGQKIAMPFNLTKKHLLKNDKLMCLHTCTPHVTYGKNKGRFWNSFPNSPRFLNIVQCVEPGMCVTMFLCALCPPPTSTRLPITLLIVRHQRVALCPTVSLWLPSNQANTLAEDFSLRRPVLTHSSPPSICKHFHLAEGVNNNALFLLRRANSNSHCAGEDRIMWTHCLCTLN